MRNPENNTIIRIISLLREGFAKTSESLRSLLLGSRGTSGGMLYSLLDLIFSRGPETWRASPRAISLGRALISPLVILFRVSRHPSSGR